jgi:streptogrisin C
MAVSLVKDDVCAVPATGRIQALPPLRRITVAALVAAAALGTLAPRAAAGTRGDTPLEAVTEAYRAAYPQLPTARARAAAARSAARRAVYDASSRDAATFGGAWFDPRTGVVHVAATTAAATKTAVVLGRRHGVPVEGHRVSRSAAQLEAQAAQLRAGRGEIGRAADGQIGVDVKTNQVVAAVPGGRREALSGSAAAGGAVRLIDDPHRAVQLDAGCTSRAACDETLRAGAIIWRGDPSIPWCAVGFTARDASNQRYVLTAGHCTTGDGVTWGTGALPIGPMIASVDEGAIDASIIEVTNPWFAGQPGGEIYTQGDSFSMPVQSVAGTSDMVAGETVCLAANFSAPNGENLCGVLATTSDAAVRGLARVDGVDACGGDSGGGWYGVSSSGSRSAYGIHSRSDGGCHGEAGGSRSWFTAIARVKDGFQPGLNVELRP